MNCALCNTGNDSHGHLFFKCRFSSNVWQTIKRKSRFLTVDNDWKEVLDELIALPNVKNIWIIIKKIANAACVYFLCQERNGRLFQNSKRNWEEVCATIENNVRLKLASFKVLKTEDVKEAYNVWEVKLIE